MLNGFSFITEVLIDLLGLVVGLMDEEVFAEVEVVVELVFVVGAESVGMVFVVVIHFVEEAFVKLEVFPRILQNYPFSFIMHEFEGS